MGKNPEANDPAAVPQWGDLWQAFTDSSKQIAEAWSSSMAPFMLARLMENPGGFVLGNELSDAIEKLAQGPKLADAWDIDRKMALVFGAWMEMRQKLTAYNTVTAAPWTEASRRFLDFMSATTQNGKSPGPGWREAFAKWSEISNEELIRNHRSDVFLKAQRELLLSGLTLRSRQDEVAEAASAMFGVPGRKDFDELTRQLTELRREVRALTHKVNASERAPGTQPSAKKRNAVKKAASVSGSDTQPSPP